MDMRHPADRFGQLLVLAWRAIFTWMSNTLVLHLLNTQREVIASVLWLWFMFLPPLNSMY